MATRLEKTLHEAILRSERRSEVITVEVGEGECAEAMELLGAHAQNLASRYLYTHEHQAAMVETWDKGDGSSDSNWGVNLDIRY